MSVMGFGTAPGVGSVYGGGAVNDVERQAVLAAAGLGGTMAGYNTAAPGMVSLGKKYQTRIEGSDRKFYNLPGSRMTAAQAERASSFIPLDRAYGEIDRIDPKDLGEFGAEVSRAIGYDVSKNPQMLNVTWKSTLDKLAVYQEQTGDTDITPAQFLKMQNDRLQAAGLLRAGGGAGGGGGGYRGPVTTKSRDRVVNLTNPSEAQLLVDDALNQYFGRDATEEERQTFYTALQKLEKKNPQIQTSTRTVTPKGDALQTVRSSAVNRGGIDARVVAQEFAASRPEAAERAASGQLMDWFMEALMEDEMKGLEVGS